MLKKAGVIFFLSSLFFLFDSSINKAKAAGDFSLTIMHVNDVHSHVEQYPKLITAVNEIRASNPSSLLLHAGDEFYGTSYFTKFHGQASVWFLNNFPAAPAAER